MVSLIDLLAAAGGSNRDVAAGSFLFLQGDRVVALHVVCTGAVQLVRRQTNGNELVLQRALPGSIVAEASVNATRYHCDGQVAAPSRLLILPMARIRTFLEQDAVFTAAWLRYLAREVQLARQRAELLALKTVAERVDAWLMLNQGVLPPRGGWRALAAELAVSPEALYRELALRR